MELLIDLQIEKKLDLYINERWSSGVIFFMVDDYHCENFLNPEEKQLFISMDWFLYKELIEEYMIKHFASEYNSKRDWDMNGYEEFGYNFYSRTAVRSILCEIYEIIRLLKYDYNNPILRKKLSCDLADCCMNEENIFHKAISALSAEEKFKLAILHRVVLIDFYKRFCELILRMMRKFPQKKYLYMEGP